MIPTVLKLTDSFSKAFKTNILSALWNMEFACLISNVQSPNITPQWNMKPAGSFTMLNPLFWVDELGEYEYNVSSWPFDLSSLILGHYTGRGLTGMICSFTAPNLASRSHRITSLSYSPNGGDVLVSYSSEYVYLFGTNVCKITCLSWTLR